MDFLKEIKAFKKLTLRRQMFVRNLLLDPQRNASRAAKASGYTDKAASVRASILLKDENIRKVIEEYDAIIASKNEDLRLQIVKELCLIAFSDVKSFMSWADHGLKLKDSDSLPEDVSKVIKEVSETLTMFGASKKVKSYDKLAAIRELNKMHGFYAAEKYDHTSSDGSVSGAVVILPANGREKKE